MSFTHVDLFSGIGGFALAAKTVWGKEYKNILFCDNDKFCQNTIRKNFPGSLIFGDIRELTADSYNERYNRRSSTGISDGNGMVQNNQTGQEAWSAAARCNEVDLLTGGFPCQPFSQAGQRKGTADDRHLWPEMLRVIQEFSPRWIIGENVGGLVTWSDGLVLRQVFTDLENEGYDHRSFIIPAVSVNAPHRRDRVWIVGNNTKQPGLQIRQPEDNTPIQSSEQRDSHATDSEDIGIQGLRGSGKQESGINGEETLSMCDYQDWNRDWREVAFETCLHRVDDGLPKRLARLPDGTSITESKWRQEALKAYGNAIVPQVAVQIMRGIKEIEQNKL